MYDATLGFLGEEAFSLCGEATHNVRTCLSVPVAVASESTSSASVLGTDSVRPLVTGSICSVSFQMKCGALAIGHSENLYKRRAGHMLVEGTLMVLRTRSVFGTQSWMLQIRQHAAHDAHSDSLPQMLKSHCQSSWGRRFSR